MAVQLNDDDDATAEWFLKRHGSYDDEVVIDLDQDEVVIGRGNNRNLKHSPGVSRKHAFFKKTNNGHWLVKDLCSTNGVYINRKKIAADHLEPIKESDIIGLGVANAISNDQFSFILCRRTKCIATNIDHVEQELNSHHKEVSPSPKKCSLEQSQNGMNELNKSSQKFFELNVNQEIDYIGQHLKNYYTEISDLSELMPELESNKNECCATILEKSPSDKLSENSSKLCHKGIVIDRTNDIHKLDCRVLLERCDEKREIFSYINAVENKNTISSYSVSRKNDRCEDTIKENSDTSNISMKTNSEDSNNNNNQFSKIKFNSSRTKTSDNDSSSDDIIIPQRNYKLHKRKIIVSSEESDSSCDKELLKSAFITKADHIPQELRNLNLTKQNSVTVPDFNDKRLENFNSSLEVNNTYCSDQCDMIAVGKDVADIFKFNSKGDKIEPELKHACVEKAFSDLHNALNPVIIDDLRLDNKVTSKMAGCNSKLASTDLDDFITSEQALEKVDLSETSIRPKPVSDTSNSDDVIVIDDENFGYSQNDDIILISDDEDLLMIKQEPNEFLNIKKECIDPVDDSDDKMPVCETADDIFDFGNDVHNIDDKELLDRIAWPPSPDDLDKEETENDFFPNLSQTFFSDDSSSHTSSDVDVKQLINESKPISNETKKLSLLEKKSIRNKCHTSTVQSIEALPMHYRPKHTRGQEEWFTEKNIQDPHNDVSNDGTTTINAEITSGTAKRFYGKNVDKKKPTKTSGSIGGKKKMGPSLKQKLKENMGHRVRCPGGGSAIIKQDVTINRKVMAQNIGAKSKLNTQWSHCISKITKKLPSIINNVHSSSKSKNVHSLHVQRFPSRTEQLTKSMLLTDSSCDQKKKQKFSQHKLGEKNLTEKEKIPSCKTDLVSPTRKSQKRENPLGNFKIPKKKKSSEEEHILPSNETSLHKSSNETKHPDKCWQVAPQCNNVKHQVSASKPINNPDGTIIKEKQCLKNCEQNLKNKRVRFAEEVSCLRHKVLLPTPKSPTTTKHIPLKNSSSALNIEPTSNLYIRNFVSQENVIAKIISWNIGWLREQCANSWPPPVVNLNSLKKVARCYSSTDNHWKTYFDLLLLEIWQSVYQAWRESENKRTHNFAVISVQQFNDMVILKCQTAISTIKSKTVTFMEGYLTIVELVLRTKNNVSAMATMFGYLCDCKIEKYRVESAHPLVQTFFTNTLDSYLVNFILKIKNREDSVNLSKLMKMKPILYLKPFLRQCEALQSMYDCSLHRCILFPQHNLCSFSDVPHGSLKSTATYNEMQRHAILGVASAVLETTEPRLLLLHGPPGTGKTHTIVGIIQQLLFRHVKNTNQQVKLLIAAPSNAAVDEIGRRLLKLRSHLIASNGKKMRFVRVGQPDMVHSELKLYFIDELVKLNLQIPNMENDPETTIHHLEARINKLQQEISSRQEHNPYDHGIARKQKELDCCRKELKFCKSKPNRHGFVDEKRKYRLKIDILTKADIILTTLNSCRQGILESAFGKNSSVTFTCCIIDEATQCTEPEILIPLHYGMNKVVLVGDPQQLPATVFSRLAVQYGFQVSLFERLKNFFDDSPGENPVLMLTDQYRMHPEICAYPSCYFYSNRLISCGVNRHFQDFPLKRYLILDIIDSRESIDNPTKIYNRAEANLVEYICSETLRLIPSNCTLGVITPYQGQKQIISDYFRSTMAEVQYRLEVNTVDGFQGREHDVIILSCVRASSSGSIGFLDDRQRLNVAITRARYSLIICGHMASLRNHRHWGNLIQNAESRNLIFPIKSSSLDLIFDLLRAKSVQR